MCRTDAEISVSLVMKITKSKNANKVAGPAGSDQADKFPSYSFFFQSQITGLVLFYVSSKLLLTLVRVHSFLSITFDHEQHGVLPHCSFCLHIQLERAEHSINKSLWYINCSGMWPSTSKPVIMTQPSPPTRRFQASQGLMQHSRSCQSQSSLAFITHPSGQEPLLRGSDMTLWKAAAARLWSEAFCPRMKATNDAQTEWKASHW